MYYSSTAGKEKIAHTADCHYVKQIRPGNRVQFENAIKARNAGYRVCKCCAPIKAYVEKQQKEIDEYCRRTGISYRVDLTEGCIRVATSYSQWKIIVNGRNDSIFLYHKNYYRYGVDQNDLVPGYHSQKVNRNSVLGYLECITDHDNYRNKEAAQQRTQDQSGKQTAKGGRKFQWQERRAKNKEKRRSVARVLSMLDAIHNKQQYRVMGL